MAEVFSVGVTSLDCIQCGSSVHTVLSNGTAECMVCDTIRYLPVTCTLTSEYNIHERIPLRSVLPEGLPVLPEDPNNVEGRGLRVHGQHDGVLPGLPVRFAQ